MLDNVIDSCWLIGPSDRPKVIDESDQIRVAYAHAAQQGSTRAPDANEEVECHYVCFTKASGNALWVLDGDRNGPLESVETSRLDGDILEGAGLELIQIFIEDCSSNDSANVGIMALVQT